MKKTSILLALMSLSLSASEVTTLEGFSAIKLDSIERYNNIMANDMNDKGEVVGQLTSDNSFSFDESLIGQAIYWDALGRPSILPGHRFVTDLNGYANAINNKGEISGRAESAPTFWTNTPSREFQEFYNARDALLAQDSSSISFGYILTDTASLDQFKKDQNSANDTFDVVNNSYKYPSIPRATAINNSNNIIGTFTTAENLTLDGAKFATQGIKINHAVIIKDGGSSFSLLGNLMDVISTSGSRPIDMNDKNQVVGFSANRAVLWQDDMIADLGTLGGDYSQAIHINNQGQIIGNSRDENNVLHAVLWDNGLMYDLSPALCQGLVGCTTKAISINDNNQLLAISSSNEGKRIIKLNFSLDALASLPNVNASLNFTQPYFVPKNIVKGAVSDTHVDETPIEEVKPVSTRISVKNKYVFLLSVDSEDNIISKTKLPIKSKKVIKIADFNNDGELDVLAKAGRDKLKLVYIDNNSKLSVRKIRLPRRSKILKIEDMNNDGRLDLLVNPRYSRQKLITL